MKALTIFLTLLLSLVAHAENYIIEDGGEYGYEASGDELFLVSYMGHKKGTYQFVTMPSKRVATFYIFEPPYKLFKVVTISKYNGATEVEDKEIFHLREGSVAIRMLDDAKNGSLKFTEGHKYLNNRVWLTSNYEVIRPKF